MKALGPMLTLAFLLFSFGVSAAPGDHIEALKSAVLTPKQEKFKAGDVALYNTGGDYEYVWVTYAAGSLVGIDGKGIAATQVEARELSQEVGRLFEFKAGDIVANTIRTSPLRSIRHVFSNGMALFEDSIFPEPITDYVVTMPAEMRPKSLWPKLGEFCASRLWSRKSR